MSLQRHAGLYEGLTGRLASSSPRRETRTTLREMAEGLLMELKDVNC